MQTRNRNLLQLAQKPVVGLSQSTVDNLIASGNINADFNPFYTGVLPSTILNPQGKLSGIISASGRYTYPRQDSSFAFPDWNSIVNPLTLITIYGGPAQWVAIDVSACDYDPRTGEVWVPSGISLVRYNEIDITYTSGFDPLNMPKVIKQCCAALVKNALARGGGTTGLLNISVPRSAGYGFSPELIDPTIARMLTPFVTVRCA